MDFFRRLFSKKHKSKWSTSGIPITRSKKGPLKPLPLGQAKKVKKPHHVSSTTTNPRPFPSKKARNNKGPLKPLPPGQAKKVKKPHHVSSNPRPFPSKKARNNKGPLKPLPPGQAKVKKPHDVSSTTTNPTLLPLENIGRPRTATSWKTSKDNLVCGEIRRPATSHAARVDSSFPHNIETSNVISTPSPACSPSPGPEISIHAPCPDKFRCLNGQIHPAFRKGSDNDEDVLRYTTDERTEHSNVCGCRQQLQTKQNCQRQAGDASSSHGEVDFGHSPLPCSIRAQHFNPSPLVSSGGSSSTGRNQQQRHCQDGNGRKAAPTQVQGPHEPPPLPPRPQSGDIEIYLDFDSASTIVPDKPDKEDSDFSTWTRLGGGILTRQVEFNWRIDQDSLKCARRCVEELERFTETMPINETVLLRNGIRSKSTDESELAREAWSILSPDNSDRHIRHITPDFCQYFFHLYHTLQRGRVLPFQIPVNIRANIDGRYGNAFSRIEGKQNNLELAKWIRSLSGEKQGVSLIALMEIKTYTDGLLKSRKLLCKILKLNSQLTTLRHATEDQISNFFATYVQAFSNRLGPDLDQITLGGCVDYFSGFWSLCTAHFNDQMAGNCIPLFEATIKKLDIVDIPLCLWLFLAGSSVMEKSVMDDIFLVMQNELKVKVPNDHPEAIAILVIIQFLVSTGHSGFFDIMHKLMIARGRVGVWERVWDICQHLEMYTTLKEKAELQTKSISSSVATAMAQRRDYDYRVAG